MFFVDSMLGDLAKWLRILGYNTFYKPSINDEILLEMAYKNNGILITRDKLLYRKAVRRGVKTIYVEKNLCLENMLKKIILKLGLRRKIDLNNTRCPKCNTPLIKVDKENIKNLIPIYVYKSYDIFLKCTGCGSIYWPGKHYKNMMKMLNQMFQKRNK